MGQLLRMRLNPIPFRGFNLRRGHRRTCPATTRTTPAIATLRSHRSRRQQPQSPAPISRQLRPQSSFCRNYNSSNSYSNSSNNKRAAERSPPIRASNSHGAYRPALKFRYGQSSRDGRRAADIEVRLNPASRRRRGFHWEPEQPRTHAIAVQRSSALQLPHRKRQRLPCQPT